MPTKSISIDVAARVLGAATSVPLLSDAPFTATGVLEKGIHVHWALPDALAKADAHESSAAVPRGSGLWLRRAFQSRSRVMRPAPTGSGSSTRLPRR